MAKVDEGHVRVIQSHLKRVDIKGQGQETEDIEEIVTGRFWLVSKDNYIPRRKSGIYWFHLPPATTTAPRTFFDDNSKMLLPMSF